MYATFFSTLALVAGNAAGRGALAGLVAQRLRSYLRGKPFDPATQTELD